MNYGGTICIRRLSWGFGRIYDIKSAVVHMRLANAAYIQHATLIVCVTVCYGLVIHGSLINRLVGLFRGFLGC